MGLQEQRVNQVADYRKEHPEMSVNEVLASLSITPAAYYAARQKMKARQANGAMQKAVKKQMQTVAIADLPTAPKSNRLVAIIGDTDTIRGLFRI